jgi:hypothetical protein
MISIKIEVRGHNNELLSEVERELEYDIVNDKWDKGTHVVLIHPEGNLVLDAVNLAEDELNQRPELWANDCNPDYHGED